jgi:hypothetical protein
VGLPAGKPRHCRLAYSLLLSRLYFLMVYTHVAIRNFWGLVLGDAGAPATDIEDLVCQMVPQRVQHPCFRDRSEVHGGTFHCFGS